MRVTKTEDPEMLAYVCIGLSAGLRRSELCALEWPEIDLQARTIEVEGVKAKTRQRRIVSVPDALIAWLQFAPKTANPVPSRNEDVCGERLKNLYSEKRDEKDEVVREAVVSIGRAMRCGIASVPITTPNIVMKTGPLRRWEIHPLSSSVIIGHW